MESWTDLCRCCLSAKSKVSLLDKEQSIVQKFLEITTIEVRLDDGLPQKLCEDCHKTLNIAYQFRKQCIKMDTELKIQLNNILTQCDQNDMANTTDDVEFANDPAKQLEALIKKEPMDSDDDFYYVLVIDNPKDKENEAPNVANIKTEKDDSNDKENPSEAIENELSSIENELQPIENNVVPDEPQEQEGSPESLLPCIIEAPEDPKVQTDYENNLDSFMITNNIPVNVPATILQNEEESQDDNDNTMDIEIIHDPSQDTNYQTDENSQDMVEEISDQNLIKILTTAGEDGTILLKDGVVQYLTDGQLIMNEDNGDENASEVILCEGDDSQFQIVKYHGSELVIEYADESSLPTVFQQSSYLCECGEQYDDAEEYEKHQKQHNPGGDHLCNLCGKGFESSEILTGHMLLHNVTSTLIQCPFCDQLVKRSALTQHIKYGHNNIKPQCDLCNKTFANPNNLKRHMMIHSGVKEFECDICLKRFHQKITMQTHKLTHMNPLSCWQCDTLFKDKESLDNHKANGVCPKNKAKEELMKTVKQEVTTSLGKLLGYACSLCKKMFSIESALERHIETTHIVDPSELLCSECGEVCTSKKEMQAHIMTHERRKPSRRFDCSVCGKGCSSQAMLIMHERVHTNERPFPCQLCPLKFKTKTHLRTHQLTHTREKKFGCSVCMKFFALKGNLVVHLRTHTGERPYVCSICNEAFIDSKYLKKHKSKKHSIDNLAWNQYLMKVKEEDTEQ